MDDFLQHCNIHIYQAMEVTSAFSAAHILSAVWINESQTRSMWQHAM